MSERTVYVVLTCRPCDKGEVWPIVYWDKTLAEAAYCRVSPVVEVRVPVEMPA